MARGFIKEKDARSVLLVDGLNLAFRWKHSGAKEFVQEYTNTVRSLANSYSCGKIIIAADMGSSTWRKNVFPDYKANRAEMRAEQTEKEKQDFTEFIEEFERCLLDMEHIEQWPVLRYQGVEADDIAAYICKYRLNLGIESIWLISTDRDWDLLLTPTVHRFSYINRKETTIDNWNDRYDFAPEEYITFKCLTGDKGDNVPGIAGIGPVRATSIMNDYGSVFDIYDSIPIEGKAKFIQNLNANADQLLTNVELMDLLTYCDEVLEGHTEDLTSKVTEYMNL